jgi:hypothetical protein
VGWLYQAPGEKNRSQREAWERYVEPLVYPPGHPRAGEYRDGLTLNDVVRARMEYLRTVLPQDELDRPQHHIVKQISYATVQELMKSYRADDPASGDAVAAALREAPSEPEAPQQNLWVPGTSSDPHATTTAKTLEQIIVSVEAPAFGFRR